ncbi:5'-methylthioadenosine/S-adenosylhomocysteine nucleosidase family protein [Clostridium sp. LBM24168]
MIFLAAALYYEAKPFIDRFCLKKDSSINKFQVFKNREIVLIVTDAGSINTACACTYLISKFNADSYDTFLNIGICGSVSKKIGIGTVVLMNKIISNEDNREFYPDVLFKHPFAEGSLESFNRVVYSNSNIKSEFVDMEGAAFFQSVAIFMPPHRIICIKVISDYLDNKILRGDDVENLIRMNIEKISDWIIEIKDQVAKPKNIFSSKDMDYINEIAINLKLSITMQHELRKLSGSYKLINDNLILALEPFTQIYCRSKREGKIYFEQLKKQLAIF